MKIRVFFFILLFMTFFTNISSGFQSSKSAIPQNRTEFTDYRMHTNLTIFINFIGYDKDLINTTAIEKSLTHSFFRGDISTGTTYIDFTFQFSFASENTYLDMKNYLDYISVKGSSVGKSLNISQVQHDLQTGERNNILIPEKGMVVDAEDVELYIETFLFNRANSQKGYTMFFLNFSCFDIGGNEHWYEVNKRSIDTNRTISYWYSGYEGITDRPTIGWGGDKRFCFLDLSSRSWYFDWIQTAWSSFYYGDFLYYKYPDLDNLTQTFDPSTSQGSAMLSQYLAEWVESYLGNVFSAYYADYPIGKSYSLQLVFDNLTVNGYSFDQINWVISEERIRKYLSLDFPWIQWKIEVKYVNLADYSNIASTIARNIKYDQEGMYVEVMDELFYFLSDQLVFLFDYDVADTVLPCYTFLTNNIRFKYNGISFAGLGGMGWEILVGNQFTIFENGNPSLPRRGMSQVMIHELGHSLGFPHPHGGSYGWGSSFFKDVMNYFSLGEERFSIFFQDGLARAHGNYYYYKAIDDLARAEDEFSIHNSPSSLLSMLGEIQTLVNNYLPLYNKMDYLSAVNSSLTAVNSIELFLYYLDHPEEIPTLAPEEEYFPFFVFLLSLLSFFIFRKHRNKQELNGK
ncbi:MAG: hypothetical protein ACTSRO_11955 [Candidatus Heimdallarchaeaceae archaeon]